MEVRSGGGVVSYGLWRVVKPCVVQATGERCKPGDIIEAASAFDVAALTASESIVPHVEREIETQDVVPFETRSKYKRRGGV